MKWKTFFVKIWWKKEIVMVYLSQIMPSCVNLNLSSPKMWAKFTHIHFSSPKIWARNEPHSWVNWKKDHSRSTKIIIICLYLHWHRYNQHFLQKLWSKFFLLQNNSNIDISKNLNSLPFKVVKLQVRYFHKVHWNNIQKNGWLEFLPY